MVYSYKQTIIKIIRHIVLIFLVGVINYIQTLPAIANLSIYLLLVGLYDYLKKKWHIRLP